MPPADPQEAFFYKVTFIISYQTLALSAGAR